MNFMHVSRIMKITNRPYRIQSPHRKWNYLGRKKNVSGRWLGWTKAQFGFGGAPLKFLASGCTLSLGHWGFSNRGVTQRKTWEDSKSTETERINKIKPWEWGNSDIPHGGGEDPMAVFVSPSHCSPTYLALNMIWFWSEALINRGIHNCSGFV